MSSEDVLKLVVANQATCGGEHRLRDGGKRTIRMTIRMAICIYNICVEDRPGRGRRRINSRRMKRRTNVTVWKLGLQIPGPVE